MGERMHDECPDCGTKMQPATLGGGGRIGWFCTGCDIYVPEGDYITVKQ